jgi:hypothetical protein
MLYIFFVQIAETFTKTAETFTRIILWFQFVILSEIFDNVRGRETTGEN